MEGILEYGVRLILQLQDLGDWLIIPMKLFSFLGNEEFYLFIAPALFWCVDTTLGLRTGLYLMISISLNSFLKLVFHTPRPYWISSGVRALSAESSFGIPSGHAQNAVIFWGTLTDFFRRRWIWILMLVVMLLIGLSRLYLGVHFFIDMLVGWLIGGLLLWLLRNLETPVTAWLGRHNLRIQLISALSVSVLLIFAGVLARLCLRTWSVPGTWIVRATAAFPDAGPIDPMSLSGLISATGAFFGMAAGAILLFHQGGFNVQGSTWKLISRYLVGLLGVIIIWAGFDTIFPEGDYFLAYLFRYLRYSLVGLWITYLAPKLFIRFNLATAHRRI